MTEPERAMLSRAILIAVEAHHGHVDRGGEPYILHVLRVMEALREHGPEAMAAGVLHDVVEDTDVDLDKIRWLIGPAVADAVDAVSRRRDESYADFVLRAKAHPLGRLVKIADVTDNLGRLTPELESLRPRYTKALTELTDG